MERISETRLRQQPSGSSLHNVIREATARNKAYQEFKKTLDSPDRKRLTELWTKQLDGAPLTLKERRAIKGLEKRLAKPLELFFNTDKGRYERAKTEVEAIAQDVVRIVKNAFISPFDIKKPERASIKTVRWYESQVNKLGDGARVNIIVDNIKDADFLYSEIKRRFSTTLDRSDFAPEGTELGYPKRLIEVRTPSGKIAEIQVMTPEGYLAKDGVKSFPEERRPEATERLKAVQERLGFPIPDGVGHYLYELHRDFNVPQDIRDEAQRLSLLYYEAFMNNKSTVTEKKLMPPLLELKDKVDAADKTTWDSSNKGLAPESLDNYIIEESKDLGEQARDAAAKLRSGEVNVLPKWLRATLPPDTKTQGSSINNALAKALEVKLRVAESNGIVLRGRMPRRASDHQFRILSSMV
ncbi:MAG: hypothetical protein LC128_07525 [Chitinophagales bacterium]|nr:hypothetical protein [Chitinophagales bacterium]